MPIPDCLCAEGDTTLSSGKVSVLVDYVGKSMKRDMVFDYLTFLMWYT